MSNQNWSCTIVTCSYSGAFNAARNVGARVSVSSWVTLSEEPPFRAAYKPQPADLRGWEQVFPIRNNLILKDELTGDFQSSVLSVLSVYPGSGFARLLCFCCTWEEGRSEDGASYDGEQLGREEPGMAEINGAAAHLRYLHLSKAFVGNWKVTST